MKTQQQPSLGPGLDELAARTKEYADQAAQRAAPATAARMAPGRAPTAEQLFGMAQASRRAMDHPALDDQGYDLEDGVEAPEGEEPVTEFSDELLDGLGDELAGKAKPKPKAEKGGEKAPSDPAAARKRALDRLKLPAKLREHLDSAEPEEVDAWLDTLVQEQGKTDDAFAERDRKFAELAEKVTAIEGGRRDPKTGKFAPAKPSNVADRADQLPEGDDQDEDLEGLRDSDPEIARALDRRDAKLKALEAENRKSKRQMAELMARHEAESAVARRETLKAAITDLQGELAGVYPQLNDLNLVRTHVAPRARALVTQGIASDMASALREAAHAAFGGMLATDQAALAARSGAGDRSAVRASQAEPPTRRPSSTHSQATSIYVRLKEQHPDWTEARVRTEAKRRAGRIVPDQPYL